MTDTPVGLCYSSDVYCDSVRIAFVVADLNGLDILECYISNAYINTPCREIYLFIEELECVNSLEGKVMKLLRALYGLKSSGSIWRNKFKDHVINCLEFTPSTIDTDMYY